jgi:hypothetical protein
MYAFVTFELSIMQNFEHMLKKTEYYSIPIPLIQEASTQASTAPFLFQSTPPHTLILWKY